jgi:hypothetical protein
MHVSKEEPARHDATWEAQCPDDWLLQKPRIQQAFYHPSMFQGITRKVKPSNDSWVARVDFKTRNVPKIMREGLHWSSANVQDELSYFERNISPSSIPDMHSGEKCDGWAHLRKYFLSSRDGESVWKAEITVYTMSLAVLGAFRLDHLTSETLGLTYATNWDGKTVYMYRKWQDTSTYMNAIYGDMPMAGRWPWPKAPEAGTVADISASTRTRTLEDEDEGTWEQL